MQVQTFNPNGDHTGGVRSALLFPGQGSQDRAMHELVRTHCPELLEHAAHHLGIDPFDRIDDGTAYLQPAVYCGALAHWRAAGEPAADFAAGHSVGELAALTAAGCIDSHEGMRLVLARATAMHHAGDTGEPGGMLAIIGPREYAFELADRHGLAVAADNAPAQLVLSGPLSRLAVARADARGRRVKAVRLRVPAALHSTAMAPAVAAFRVALDATEFHAPHMAVFANVTAAPFTDIPAELARALTSRVRWRETVLSMHRAGAGTYREMGGQGILSGLVERTLAAQGS